MGTGTAAAQSTGVRRAAACPENTTIGVARTPLKIRLDGSAGQKERTRGHVFIGEAEGRQHKPGGPGGKRGCPRLRVHIFGARGGWQAKRDGKDPAAPPHPSPPGILMLVYTPGTRVRHQAARRMCPWSGGGCALGGNQNQRWGKEHGVGAYCSGPTKPRGLGGWQRALQAVHTLGGGRVGGRAPLRGATGGGSCPGQTEGKNA